MSGKNPHPKTHLSNKKPPPILLRDGLGFFRSFSQFLPVIIAFLINSCVRIRSATLEPAPIPRFVCSALPQQLSLAPRHFHTVTDHSDEHQQQEQNSERWY